MEKTNTKTHYSIMAKLNGSTFKLEVNNLKDAFRKFRPQVLKTRLILHIESAEGVCDKIVMTQMARAMFKNERTLDAFIGNLIFKPHAI